VPDKKITELDALATPDDADELAIVDVSAGTTKKITAANLLAGGGATVTVQEADPGAIGAKRLWLQVILADGSGDGGYGSLWVRNSTNTGWNSAGPMSYSDGFATYLESPTGSGGEIILQNEVGSELIDATFWKISGGNKDIFVADTGVHLGSSETAAALLTGSADPSADDGVAAPVGSVYLRVDAGVGTLWQKIGGEDTEWTLIGGLTNTSLAAYVAAGNIAMTATNAVIQLVASGQAIILESSFVRLVGLPTSDPASPDTLWNNAGVLMVSSG
jgi:hypothetical protein